MKKLIALALTAVMLAAALCAPAWAVSMRDGENALKEAFADGAYGSYDFVYYSPATGGDKTKYPLVVWLHGAGSGKSPRAQLAWYHFCNWASDEYQARFSPEGGAFLLMPRASASIADNWDPSMCSGLKQVIDRFIEDHKANIDTDRISIGGYSTGGSMVWYMLDAYPQFFAAGLPMSSLIQPTTANLDKLRDVSLWYFVSDRDPYPGATTAAASMGYRYIAGHTNRPDGVRMTRFSECFLANGEKKHQDGKVANDCEHYTWECATYDMFMNDGTTPYVSATTTGADGKVLTFTPGDALITWLARQKRPEKPGTSFIDRLRAFFRMLLDAIRRFFETP